MIIRRIAETIRHCRFFQPQIRGPQSVASKSYNPSLCGSVVAYRADSFDRVSGGNPSRIVCAHVIEKAGEFVCRGNHTLDLQSTTGWCEDPRLFKWNGDLWIFYTDGRRMHAAQLDEDLNVAWNTQLEYGNEKLEKNWTPWVWGDELYAVYRTWPFEVISVQKTEWNLRCLRTHISSPEGLPHSARGGAPIHRSSELESTYFWQRHVETDGERHYRIGMSIISGHPTRPIMHSHQDDVIVAPKSEKGHSVLFPGSAEWIDGTWRLACGLHDRECVIVDITDEELEAVQPNGHA